jgi:hypothetical protein
VKAAGESAAAHAGPVSQQVDGDGVCEVGDGPLEGVGEEVRAFGSKHWGFDELGLPTSPVGRDD